MSIKNFSPIIMSLILVLACQKSAYSIPTKWEDTGVNMSELLSSGWKLSAHGVAHVAANGNGISNGFNEITYTFILTKNDKNIMCLVENPKPPIASTSGCRKLN